MLTHHAQLIEGSIDSYNSLLADLETNLGMGKNHPDLNIFSLGNEKLGIDDAHNIHHAILRNPTTAPQTVTIIYAHTLTETAQNALLKIFEEPPKHSFIFLVTNYIAHLLPTLRSRFVMFKVDNETEVAGGRSDKKDLLLVESFLKSGIEKRLVIIKDIHAGLDKETVTIGDVWNFVNEIEKEVRERMEKGSGPEEIAKLDALIRAQQFMHTPGNSVKMLLEYLAVRL